MPPLSSANDDPSCGNTVFQLLMIMSSVLKPLLIQPPALYQCKSILWRGEFYFVWDVHLNREGQDRLRDIWFQEGVLCHPSLTDHVLCCEKHSKNTSSLIMVKRKQDKLDNVQLCETHD